MIPIKERVANNHLLPLAHKKEEDTYHLNEKCLDSLALGKGMPLLLIPEYSGINKGQRVPDRSKTAHGKPLVKCFLTSNLDAHQQTNGLGSCGTYTLWYMYTMEYYSAIKKNSFESILMRWMKLEPIIQSEVSQKDKDHYNILTHIYGI